MIAGMPSMPASSEQRQTKPVFRFRHSHTNCVRYQVAGVVKDRNIAGSLRGTVVGSSEVECSKFFKDGGVKRHAEKVQESRPICENSSCVKEGYGDPQRE